MKVVDIFSFQIFPKKNTVITLQKDNNNHPLETLKSFFIDELQFKPKGIDEEVLKDVDKPTAEKILNEFYNFQNIDVVENNRFESIETLFLPSKKKLTLKSKRNSVHLSVDTVDKQITFSIIRNSIKNKVFKNDYEYLAAINGIYLTAQTYLNGFDYIRKLQTIDKNLDLLIIGNAPTDKDAKNLSVDLYKNQIKSYFIYNPKAFVSLRVKFSNSPILNRILMKLQKVYTNVYKNPEDILFGKS